MFKNEYQGGPFFEIFSAHYKEKEIATKWKFGHGIKKVFDKEVKSSVFCVEGSPTTTKMQLPKEKQPLTLVQRYLVFQVFVPRGQEFSLELGITDLGNNKRRLMLSSSQKETHVTPLHARVPLTILRRHIWLNLCVDMVSVVGEIWQGQTYKCIESVCVSANCKLRRIFTMKNQPPDTAQDEEMYGCEASNTGELDQIPRQYQFATDVQYVTQLLNMTKIRHAERLKGGGDTQRSPSNLDIDLNASGRRTASLNDSGYHIAFGSKVPGAPTQTNKNKGNITNRSTRSTYSRADESFGESTYRDLSSSITEKDGISSGYESGGGREIPQPTESIHRAVLHRRQHSDPANQHDIEMLSRIDYERPNLPTAIVQPHPPREPSSDRLRRRIRVKNGGNSANKERVSSAGSLKDEGNGSISHSNSAKSSSSQGDERHGRDETVRMESRRQRLASDGELTNKKGKLAKDSSTNLESSVGAGISLAQSYKKEYNRGDYEGDGAVIDDSIMGVIDILNPTSGELMEDEREDLGEYEESDEELDEEKRNSVYLFVSKPKSAPRRHFSPNQVDTEEEVNQIKSPLLSKGKTHRGPRLEHDFVHSSDSSFEEDDIQKRKIYSGSRPSSASSSRPHSGSTSSRPQSGTTSRPHSGTTSRPHSGTTSRPQSNTSRPTSNTNQPQNSANKPQNSKISIPTVNTNVSQKSTKSVPKPQRKDKIDVNSNLNHLPKTAIESPEPRKSTQFLSPRPNSEMNGNLTARSMSRMSRKSVREIPQDDVRLSVVKSTEKPYDFTKYSAINYQMEDVTESFEAQMFSSMKRQTEEDYEDISASESPRKLNPHVPSSSAINNKTPPNPSPREATNNHRNLYDFSPTLTLHSDDDTSTWQAPPMEMKVGVSTDTLTSSNPRDWSGAFSPPIVFPGGHPSDSTEDLSSSSLSPRKTSTTQDFKSHQQIYFPNTQEEPGGDEDELDLLYDPCLNCYYDPHTMKYYELI